MSRTSPLFSLVGERLRGHVLEVVTVEECNLTCRSCTHQSPASPGWQVDPGRLADVLATLGRAFSCDVVKLMGGEPLLHERLGDVIAAVRDSAVCAEVHLVTNGLLLARVKPAVLRGLDQVSVSVYPGIRIGDAAARVMEALPLEAGVRVVKTPMPVFQESFSTRGTADEALVRHIYDSCKVVHEWGCSTLFDRHFFKCPQAYVLRRMTRGESVDYDEVGIDVMAGSDAHALRCALASYLNDPRPLISCNHCLGTSGASFAHVVAQRVHWMDLQDRPTEKLLQPGTTWGAERR
jgi:organic radical activating enzyme